MNKKDCNDKSYCLDGQVCIKFGFVDPLLTYEQQTNLKFGIVDHFIDKKRVVNTKINKNRVENTKFNINVTVQAVCYM